MAPIRVLIADDHFVVRAGLRLLIGGQPDMEVVGEATNGHEAVHLARHSNPDVLVVDLTMPGLASGALIGRLKQEHPRTRILVLTMHDDPVYLRMALAAGACGYVVKTAADTELLSAIRAVHQGRIFVDFSLKDEVDASIFTSQNVEAETGSPAQEAHPLSPREREVLVLLAQGHTNQQIADRLFLSVKTVETYRARVANKLGLRSRADFVRYAMDMGLLSQQM